MRFAFIRVCFDSIRTRWLEIKIRNQEVAETATGAEAEAEEATDRLQFCVS